MNEFIATSFKQDSLGNQVVGSPSLHLAGNALDFNLPNIFTLRNHQGRWIGQSASIKESTERQIPRETAEEASLLTIIQENSQLPEKKQQRYQQLWRKCEDETLTEDELIEYQALLSQLEARNLKRIEALIALTQSRGKTLGEIIAELGLKEGNNAF